MLKNLIMIASSTGGPRVVRDMLRGLPRLDACIVVIQHMQGAANEMFANSLSRLCEMDCSVATQGDRLRPGSLLVAPAGKHLSIRNGFDVEVRKGERVNFVRPSADVAMLSLQPVPGRNLMGIVLTGIGRDGTDGIEHIARLGGTTIAQAPSTCVIQDMPRFAIATGCIHHVLPPNQIRKKLMVLSPLRVPDVQ